MPAPAEPRVLPVEPMRAWLERAAVELNLPEGSGSSAAYEALTGRPRRTWMRYLRAGAFTVKAADEVATGCGVHPRAVWGRLWDDPYDIDPDDWPWPWWYPEKERCS